MSGMLEESARVSPTRGGIQTPPPALRASEEAAAPKATETPGVEIVLSAEAKAALASISVAREKGVERAERAVQGAKEVATATGMSEAEAVAKAQPLRSPPPAKAVVLFQASLGETSTEAGKLPPG